MENSQSIRLYILGKKTMESEEENSLATWDTCRCTSRNCLNSRHCYSSNDYWNSCICGT
uniref:Uncharacterized protein n=1 Tax=Laticauda laticaudata TaxID=8630 RepID=A0A8C5SZK3_LATLA